MLCTCINSHPVSRISLPGQSAGASSCSCASAGIRLSHPCCARPIGAEGRAHWVVQPELDLMALLHPCPTRPAVVAGRAIRMVGVQNVVLVSACVADPVPSLERISCRQSCMRPSVVAGKPSCAIRSARVAPVIACPVACSVDPSIKAASPWHIRQSCPVPFFV